MGQDHLTRPGPGQHESAQSDRSTRQKSGRERRSLPPSAQCVSPGDWGGLLIQPPTNSRKRRWRNSPNGAAKRSGHSKRTSTVNLIPIRIARMTVQKHPMRCMTTRTAADDRSLQDNAGQGSLRPLPGIRGDAAHRRMSQAPLPSATQLRVLGLGGHPVSRRELLCLIRMTGMHLLQEYCAAFHVEPDASVALDCRLVLPAIVGLPVTGHSCEISAQRVVR